MDENLVLGCEVMHIAFEGPELTLVDFDNIQNILKENNCSILL